MDNKLTPRMQVALSSATANTGFRTVPPWTHQNVVTALRKKGFIEQGSLRMTEAGAEALQAWRDTLPEGDMDDGPDLRRAGGC